MLGKCANADLNASGVCQSCKCMRARKGSPVSKFKAASSNVANAAKRRSQEPGREPGFALRSPSTESLVVSLVVSRASPRVRVRVYGPVLLQSFNWQSCEQYFTLLQFKSIILSWSLEHHKHRVCAAPRSNWLGSTWLGPKRLRKRPDPLQRTFFVLEVEPWNIPDSNFPWESLKGSQWKSGSGIFHGLTLCKEPSLCWK